MFTLKDEVANKGAAPVTLYPYGLVSRHGTPQTLGYYILHEGMIGVFGDKGLQEETYSDVEKKKTISYSAHQFLARHHRQVLGRDAHSRHQEQDRRQVLRRPARQPQDLPGRLHRPVADHRAGRRAASPKATCSPAPRKSSIVDGYETIAAAQSVRPADRLGLVLLHHQAAVPGDGLDLPQGRQFRPGDPDRHGADQDRVLPARQQVLRLDGEDEGGAAGDDGDPRALQRRQDEAATGDDGAVQEGEDQSDCRLPADRRSDSGVLRALQGAVRHHRDAARAVLRLDQGPGRARPDHGVQPVRADPVRPLDTCRWSARS